MPNRRVLQTALQTVLQTALPLLLLALLALGCGFRWINLDQKVFWVDEVATVIRAVGYTRLAVMTQLADGAIHTPGDLLAYQQLSSARTWADTLQALVRSPEHAPLYFVLIRFWMEVWGSSVAAVRSFSVVSSLLTLPWLYYFCRLLFGSRQTAWWSVLLMAISPFFIAYAQEARPYSFWLLTVVLCYTALLRALHNSNLKHWLIYALTLILSAYTSLLTLFLVIGQGIYVFVLTDNLTNDFTDNLTDAPPLPDQGHKIRRGFLLALGMATLAFLPWLGVIWQQWQALGANTTWMRTALHPLVMLAIWLHSFAIVFFDVPVVIHGGMAILQALVAASLLGLMGYALYCLRRLPFRVSGLLAALCLPIPVALIGLDLLFQGQASATARYLIPCQLGVLIAVAHFASSSSGSLRRFLWGGLITLSFISNGVNWGRAPDYQKDRNRHNPDLAALVNLARQPVLFAEPTQTLDLLSLSHHLKDTVQIQVLPVEQLPTLIPTKMPPTCPTYFLFNPSKPLLEVLQQMPGLTLQERFQPRLLTPTDVYLSLWSVQPPSFPPDSNCSDETTS